MQNSLIYDHVHIVLHEHLIMYTSVLIATLSSCPSYKLINPSWQKRNGQSCEWSDNLYPALLVQNGNPEVSPRPYNCIRDIMHG